MGKKLTHVKPYRKSNGRKVKEHRRRTPKDGPQGFLASLFGW